MKFNTNEINALIRERRSVFPSAYSGEKIDDAIVDQILENANWAPTHKLTEPWRFCVFTGDGLKELGRIMSEQYREVTERDGSFMEKKYNNLKNKPSEASHVIVIGMKRDPEERIREIEEISAVACAVQNIALSAAAYGLGGYWGTGGITYMPNAQRHFGWGAHDKLMGFFYLGIHKEQPGPGKRNPIEEKVTWVRD